MEALGHGVHQIAQVDGVLPVVRDERVERAVDAHELAVTGGSDAHDRRIGRAGLGRGAYRAFRERLDA